MPARRPAQRVKDASLLDPPCRPIALRYRRQNLAPRAHADNSRHERHPADSAALTQSSAETSSVTFLVRQCEPPPSAPSSDEVIKAVEPYDADQDEVDRDNIVQQSRHEQNQ